jgi:hypothetical protein
VPRKSFDAMLDLATGALPALAAKQREALDRAGVDLGALMGT